MKILGYDYSVDYSLDSRVLEAAGTCDSSRLEIRIASDQPPAMQRSALLHEAIEAINAHLDIGLDERQVRCLEVGLFGVVKVVEDDRQD